MKPLTGLDKVALLLKGLGPKAAETVLAQLGPEQASRVRAHMQTAESTPDQLQTLQQLLREAADAMPAAPRPDNAT